MDVAKGLKEGDIPDIQYHRECRSIFTLKKSLDAIKENQADSCTLEKNKEALYNLSVYAVNLCMPASV